MISNALSTASSPPTTSLTTAQEEGGEDQRRLHSGLMLEGHCCPRSGAPQACRTQYIVSTFSRTQQNLRATTRSSSLTEIIGTGSLFLFGTRASCFRAPSPRLTRPARQEAHLRPPLYFSTANFIFGMFSGRLVC
jgi:hypothetical protein